MEEEKYKLKKLIKKLDQVRGRHTELVSVYVPAGHNLDVVRSQIASETDTAGNIKSKTVRTNVVTALEKIGAELKKYKKTPENGMIIFSGNVSEVEGRPDYQIWTIHPPEPINVKLYRCDQIFLLDPLKDLLEAKRVYGLVVLDVKEANIALLKGKSIIPVKSMESYVAGKMKAGGQSAARFARAREEQIKYFFNKIADRMNEAFSKIPNLAGIIIGGPGPSKEEFINGKYLPANLQKKIIGIKDIGYSSEHGLKDLVNKSEDLLKQEEIMLEKQVLTEFFQHLSKDDGLASYGEHEVWNNLEKGAVERILLSESLEEEKLDKFVEQAKNFGSEIIFISEATPEGVQLKELGGFGAILRYKAN